jgi:hypothetical protein
VVSRNDGKEAGMQAAENTEQVDTLVNQADVITDTVPAAIFDAIERYYNRHGYRLQSWTLVGRETYDATFTK